jgi:hypothetical protein
MDRILNALAIDCPVLFILTRHTAKAHGQPVLAMTLICSSDVALPTDAVDYFDAFYQWHRSSDGQLNPQYCNRRRRCCRLDYRWFTGSGT